MIGTVGTKNIPDDLITIQFNREDYDAPLGLSVGDVLFICCYDVMILSFTLGCIVAGCRERRR